MGNIKRDILGIAETSNVEKLSLEEIFIISQREGYACAIYRLPNQNSLHLIIDLSSGNTLHNLHLDEIGSGFVFHPFSSKSHEVRFIKRDIHIVKHIDSKKQELIHSSITDTEFMQIFNNQYATDHPTSFLNDSLVLSCTDHKNGKNEFIKLVRTAIEEIKNNQFQKVVLSRCKTVDLHDQFSAFEFFETLCGYYSNTFVYLAFIPGAGQWIGATPETLINIDENGKFQTVALAATQAYRNDIALEDTTWSQKDIEEQAMVSRYIINCFKKIRLREFEEVGPRTHVSGNLVHLKTEYNVDMEQVAFPQLGTVMLELLHPTSAVCGMPKEPAQGFIMNNEGFDREYFSGFLGPVNIQNETNIFVNLRCMKIMQSQAKLFSGAGIISNSNPEKEWNETEIKMDTLLNVLKELD